METSALPDARAGQLYLVNLQATGGIGGYTWRLAGGRLPSGLTFAADGTISGTPVLSLIHILDDGQQPQLPVSGGLP